MRATTLTEPGPADQPSRLRFERTLRAAQLGRSPNRNGPRTGGQSLHNDYYTGALHYAGHNYEGRHEPLVDRDTFDKVQQILAAQRQSGERSWIHHNYLRGTLHCAQCGRRLLYTRNRGRRGGIYEYFVCTSKSARICSQPHHRTQAVEEAVEHLYSTVELTDTQRNNVHEMLQEHLDQYAQVADRETRRARAALDRLDNQERKLLAAHYADRISDYIYAEEQERIRRERIAATKLLQQHQTDHKTILETLDLALDLTADIENLYLVANPTERRLLNQAFFERVEIDSEEITGTTLQPPFRQIATAASQPRRPPRPANARKNARTPARTPKDEGSYVTTMVGGARHCANQPSIPAPPIDLRHRRGIRRGSEC